MSVVSQLKHPNIIKYYSHFIYSATSICLVTEYCQVSLIFVWGGGGLLLQRYFREDEEEEAYEHPFGALQNWKAGVARKLNQGQKFFG